MSRNRYENMDASTRAVLRFGAMRDNPELISPLELPSVASYSSEGNPSSGFESQEKERIRQDAFEEGRLQGYNEAREQAQSEFGAKVRAFDSAISSLSQAIESISSKSEILEMTESTDLATFVVDLVEAVLSAPIFDLRQRLIEVLKSTISMSIDAKAVTIRLNPKDFQVVSVAFEERKIPPPSGLLLVEDPDIEAGAAILEADSMKLDLQISSALARMREVLNELGND
ncbi:FliH/SctL family protein [Acidithrix sp. C25]|uniref:FliH/SctL family protein n=1 Tax=Acidithrix sp. C25 TaxID=1671482 RepID=UPI00191BB51D|nr:FliH/SctL family protein [Acidithrix sp. C25]CAG4933362.1 unnamed protein product [Acidithrix sp. C25]